MTKGPSLLKHFNRLLKTRDQRDRQRYKNVNEKIAALKELVLTRADTTALAVKIAMDAAEKASEKAAHADDQKFANTNEWRAAMNDLQTQFQRKAELEPTIKSLEHRIATLETTGKVDVAKKEGMSTAAAMALSAIGTLAIIIPSALALITFVKRS